MKHLNRSEEDDRIQDHRTGNHRSTDVGQDSNEDVLVGETPQKPKQSRTFGVMKRGQSNSMTELDLGLDDFSDFCEPSPERPRTKHT